MDIRHPKSEHRISFFAGVQSTPAGSLDNQQKCHVAMRATAATAAAAAAEAGLAAVAVAVAVAVANVGQAQRKVVRDSAKCQV